MKNDDNMKMAHMREQGSGCVNDGECICFFFLKLKKEIEVTSYEIINKATRIRLYFIGIYNIPDIKMSYVKENTFQKKMGEGEVTNL